MPDLAKANPTFSRRALHRTQLSDEIADHVRHLIMTGQIRSGDFLRLERFADELGVSVTPVREAMLKLRGEGFVALAARRGFLVSPLSRDDIRDVYFIQATLAGELAFRACVGKHTEAIETLWELHENFKQAIAEADPEAVTTLNNRFHRQVNLLAGAPKLGWFLGAALKYSPHVYFDQIPGWTELALETQPKIIESLAQRKGQQVRTVLNTYLTSAGELLIQYLDGIGIWSNGAEGQVKHADDQRPAKAKKSRRTSRAKS